MSTYNKWAKENKVFQNCEFKLEILPPDFIGGGIGSRIFHPPSKCSGECACMGSYDENENTALGRCIDAMRDKGWTADYIFS